MRWLWRATHKTPPGRTFNCPTNSFRQRERMRSCMMAVMKQFVYPAAYRPEWIMAAAGPAAPCCQRGAALLLLPNHPREKSKGKKQQTEERQSKTTLH